MANVPGSSSATPQCRVCGSPMPLMCDAARRRDSDEPHEVLTFELVYKTGGGTGLFLEPFSGASIWRPCPENRFPFAFADLEPVLVRPADPDWDPKRANSRENYLRDTHLRQLKADQDVPSEGWIFRE